MNIIDATVHEFGQTVPLPRDDVFAWHTRPGAFSRLQAPWCQCPKPSAQVTCRFGAVCRAV